MRETQSTQHGFEKQFSPLGRREGLACALIPVTVEAVYYLGRFGFHSFDGFADPDSYMRLVRLREIVAAHRMLHTVANDASGHGALLHWSHLLDAFILLLAAPLGLFLPTDAALHVAGLLFGIAAIGALGYAAAWAIAPFVSRGWRWMAPVATILAPTIWNYGQVGVVHHHIPVVLVAVMSWGWAGRIIAWGRGGAALGAWAAIGVWLTPEALPLSVLGFGAVYIAWLQRGGPLLPAAMRAAGLTLLFAIGVAWLVDPPMAGHRSVEFDRLSIVFVGVAAVFAAIGCATVAIERHVRSWFARLSVSAAIGIALGVAWLAYFPQAIAGADTIMTEFERHAFFDPIVEMRPIQSLSAAVECLFAPLLAALFLVGLAIRRRSILALYGATGVAAMMAMAMMHVRFSPYPAAAAAVLLPAMLDAVPARWSPVRIGTVVLMLIVPFVGALQYTAETTSRIVNEHSCSISKLAGFFAPFGDAVALAHINVTPELLYRTHLKTVGSLYHRNPRAFMRLLHAWRSQPNTEWNATQPTVEVLETEATIVIFCPTQGRSSMVDGLQDDTLFDWLNYGRIPSWMHEVARDPDSGIIVYRIDR